MKEPKLTSQPTNFKEDKSPRIATLLGISSKLTIINDGIDDKTDIVISYLDSEKNYDSKQILSSLTLGEVKNVDLSVLNIKIVKIMLRSRGKDGIGRYIKPLTANTGKYFTTFYCKWAALSGNNMIEEHFFSGEEANI